MTYCLADIVNLFAFSSGSRELRFLLVSLSRGNIAGPGDRGITFCSLGYFYVNLRYQPELNLCNTFALQWKTCLRYLSDKLNKLHFYPMHYDLLLLLDMLPGLEFEICEDPFCSSNNFLLFGRNV